MAQYAGEELNLDDVGSKRVPLVYYTGADEPYSKLHAFNPPGDGVDVRELNTQPSDLTLKEVKAGKVVQKVWKRRAYKSKRSISYLDFLAPEKRSYSGTRKRNVKSRKYKKPVRRARRVSKPTVRASASCSCSHGRKSYSRRPVKSTRRKRY